MSARHSASPQPQNRAARTVVLVGAAVVAVVAVIALVVTGLSRLGGGGFCGDRTEVAVAAEPGIADQVRTLADEADGCHDFRVDAVSSAEMTTRLADREALPDVWVPDSAVRLAGLSQDVQIPFETVLNSLASTPVVIASRDAEVDMDTWTSALAAPELTMGDPTVSGTADAPILAATSEVESMRATREALGVSMAALAQRQAGRTEAPPTESEMLDAVVAGGGAAIVSEQQGVLAARAGEGSGLALAAPRTGAVFLTYPLAVTTQDPTRREAVTEAATALRDVATSDDFVSGLGEAGFRGADRAPLAGDDAAPEGVGEVEALVVRDPTRLQTALQRWRLLAMPTRSLVLMDTSGSMGYTMEGTGTTRIQTLVETATAGLGQFPDDAALGLWAFGGSAGVDGSPYAAVAPLQRLDAPGEDGATHREALGGALASLPGLVGGGTDLYQTVLDAYAQVQQSYDPNMVNCVIVISDGANDAVSDLGTEEFLARLRDMVDPSRPVIAVTIGLLDDADPATLADIAEATGGSSHIAHTPEEIVRVFATAIQQRGGA